MTVLLSIIGYFSLGKIVVLKFLNGVQFRVQNFDLPVIYFSSLVSQKPNPQSLLLVRCVQGIMLHYYLLRRATHKNSKTTQKEEKSRHSTNPQQSFHITTIAHLLMSGKAPQEMEATTIELPSKTNVLTQEVALDLLGRRARSDETHNRQTVVGPCSQRYPDNSNATTKTLPPCVVDPGSAIESLGLYGREEECAKLRDYYQKALANSTITQPDDDKRPQLLLVTGPSGMGKTTLTMSLRNEMKHATLAKGKFQTRQAAPYAAYSELISGLLRDTIERRGEQDDPARILEEKKRIKEALGDDIGTIIPCIPALAAFLDEESQYTLRSNTFMGHETMLRFRRVFCKLIASLCSAEAPLIVFLDDLQWSGKEELDLLVALLTDASIQGLVVVGACRDNEVPMDHDLAFMLRHLEDNYSLQVTQIALSGLAKDAITQVSEDFDLLLLSSCQSALALSPFHNVCIADDC